MNTPSCRSCGTDAYIRILKYTPGYVDTMEFPVGPGRTVTKHSDVGPVAEYFCQKCGSFNGHTVPEGWEPKPDPSERELAKLGSWTEADGRRVTIRDDGSRMETL